MKWKHTVGGILADNWCTVRNMGLNGHQLKHLHLISRCHTLMYNLLFKTSWKTIQTFAADHKYLGAQIGMTAVLHTWSQSLGLHPHLHCIVPGGGLTKYGKWKHTRSKGKYLFPVKAMAEVYKAIFISELKQLSASGTIPLTHKLKEQLYNKRWVVYAKRPFAKPDHVIEYLGRYSHKVAISNYRILECSNQHILFKWKNYKNAAKTENMQLNISEFIRRFALHILPHKFVRIRHFGILSFHGRAKVIPEIQDQQGYKPSTDPVYQLPAKATQCLVCNSTKLKYYVLLPVKPRSP